MLKQTLKIILLSCYLVILLPFSSVLAEETPASYVSPALLNLSLKPGESKQSSYSYTNTTEKDQTISIELRAFNPSDGEHGIPLFTNKDGSKVTSPLTNWIKLTKKQYTVSKGDKATINFTITVPKDAKSGKYYTSIFNLINEGEVKDGSLIKKEIGVTLVVEVTNPPQEKTSSQTKFDFHNLTFKIGIIIIAIALLLLILLIIVRLRNKKNRNFFEEKEESKKIIKTESKKTRKKGKKNA